MRGIFAPSGTVGEGVVESDLGNVDNGSRGAAGGDGNGSLEDVNEVTSDVVAALLIRLEAESATTVGKTRRAATPADRADTVSAVLTLVIAETGIVLLIIVAGQRSASGATIRVLGARDTDVGHARRTIRRADAACHVVEVIAALGVPEKTPLLAVVTMMGRAGSATVGIGLIAEGTIVTELTWAVFPADGSYAIVTVSADRVA